MNVTTVNTQEFRQRSTSEAVVAWAAFLFILTNRFLAKIVFG